MSRQTCASARSWVGSWVVALVAVAPSAAQAASIDSSKADSTAITQKVTLPLTPTDFAPGNSLVPSNPLSLDKFDTQDGSRILDKVTLTIHAAIENQFGMKFTTPATITNSIGSADGSIPGPSISILQPDAKTPLLTVGASSSDTLSRSVTYGFKPGETLPREFSSAFDKSSPYYLAPTSFDKSQTLELTSPADLALFTGAGQLKLPVSAKAWSKFTSSSGNGYGSITTQGTADVTVTYDWHDRIPAPQTVPEPAAVMLWGVAGLGLALSARRKALGSR